MRKLRWSKDTLLAGYEEVGRYVAHFIKPQNIKYINRFLVNS